MELIFETYIGFETLFLQQFSLKLALLCRRSGPTGHRPPAAVMYEQEVQSWADAAPGLLCRSPKRIADFHTRIRVNRWAQFTQPRFVSFGCSGRDTFRRAFLLR
jgi:hypothetical protein